MNDIFLTPLTVSELRTLISAAVTEALSHQPPSTTANSELPIGIDEACRITGLAKPTIYSKFSRREIPGYRRGGKVYFYRAELLNWINQGKRSTLDEIKEESLNSIPTR